MRAVVESSPWDFGWTAIAGIATAFLALVTWWLAKSTRDLARETDQDVRAAWRPILVVGGDQEVKVILSQDADGTYKMDATFFVTNVGRGPALNCELLELKSRSAGGPRRDPVKLSTIAVGSQNRITTVASGIAACAPNWTEPQKYVFRIRYEDIGRNLHETVFVFVGAADRLLSVESSPSVAARLDETEVLALGEQVPAKGWPR